MDTEKKLRFNPSLGTRMFLATALVVVLAVGTAVAVTWLLGRQIADRAVRQALGRSARVLSMAEQDRIDYLRLTASDLARDSNFVSYVVQAAAAGDSFSITDQLEERRSDLGFDIAAVLDAEGHVLGRTASTGTADLSQDPLVAALLEDYEVQGVWGLGDELFETVAVPMTAGGLAEGFLVAGVALDEPAAIELRRVSDTEVSFLGRTVAGLAVRATTLDNRLAEDLASRLGEHPEMLETEPGDDDEPILQKLEIGGREWLALTRPLHDVDGSVVGAVVNLASLEEQFAPYRRISNSVVLVGLVAIVLALVSSFFLSRKLLRPERELAAAAKAAAEGNFDQEIVADRSDEIGQLASAFRTLLHELREKRDMEVYINELVRNMPEAEDVLPEHLTPSQLSDPTEVLAKTQTLGATAVTMASVPGGERPTLSSVLPGNHLGQRFGILSVLGAGGMGVVYKARDFSLDELVALKMLKPDVWDDAERLEKLKDELKLARRIAHPNVLRTYDFGEIDGVPYISMEYVRGITLRRLLDQSGRLPLTAGLRLARQLCRGLAAAHAQSVIHRDIKPENLIIEHTGNVKLMDFGIAQRVQRRPTQSQAGSVVGTPFYLAPEQLQGREPDERADLYACGVVFFEIFTGHLPYPSAGSLMEIIGAKINREPDRPSQHWPAIPSDLEQIILRCLERDPENRYPNVGSLLHELEGARA